jgi:hypothetical protein
MRKATPLFALLIFALPAAGQTALQNSKFKIQDSETAALAQPFLPVILQNSRPDHTRRDFWVLAGVGAGLTGLDVWTSQRNQARGAIEGWSSWEMGRRPGVARMSVALGAECLAWNGAAYLLDRRGHHRLARIAQLAGAGLETAAVTNNLAWQPPAAVAPTPSRPLPR